MAANIGNPKQLELSIINRIKNDLFLKPWRKQEDFIGHANSISSKILQYVQHVFDAIAPVLKTFADSSDFVNKLMMKNRGNSPVLKFLKNIQDELRSLVPVNFPELYSFDRVKELPRYLKALAMRAERGSLNLASAEKKMQEVMIYSSQLQQMHTTNAKEDILVDYSEEKRTKIEELFWMIEEYKVSLFAQELKTPYPVSPKKLSLLIKEIEEL